MKKIFKNTFVLLSVLFSLFVFTNQTYAAVHNATATISPNTAFVDENLTYSYTLTNSSDSTSEIGSLEIQLPTGFGTPSISISNTSPDRVWELGSTGGYTNGFDSETRKIGVKATTGTSKLDNNEFVVIEITTTAPSIANSYEWTAFPLGNLGFSGTAFSITSSQPSVNVTAPIITLSSIAITTPATKLNYTVGDSLDITGLVVTGTYSDTTTTVETITNSNITGFDSSAPATDQVLTITIGDKTITYTININAIQDEEYDEEVDEELNFDITLANGCEIKDINDVNYTYPKNGSQDEYLAICVLDIAVENAQINAVELTDDFGFGLYVKSINNIQPGATEYWALYLNNTFASCGIECLVIANGDTLSFILSDWMANTESTKINFHIIGLTQLEDDEEIPSGCTSGCGGGSTPTPSFSVPNAISYLQNVQAKDGSFGGSDLYTDWVAIAYGANNTTGSSRDLLVSYLNSHNSLSSLITDNERRAMALLALGQNPYDFNGVNYIADIVADFDGTQFGDTNLANDDIFAIIPLASAGYTVNDEIITKDISFILSAQNTNGSWDNSVDMTSAGIQALKPFESISGVSDAITKAKDYLVNQQGNDGGWGNASSTSWAIQAGSAIGVTFSKNGKTGLDYLANLQTNANNNGSVLASTDTLENNIWATSYAIPAGLNKSWANIMQKVNKPVTQIITSGGGGSNPPTNQENKKEETIIEKEEIKPLPNNQEEIEEEILVEKEQVIPEVILAEIKPETIIEKPILAIETEQDLENTINPDFLTASAGDSIKIPKINFKNFINKLKINALSSNQLPFVRGLKAMFFGFPKLFHR